MDRLAAMDEVKLKAIKRAAPAVWFEKAFCSMGKEPIHANFDTFYLIFICA